MKKLLGCMAVLAVVCLLGLGACAILIKRSGRYETWQEGDGTVERNIAYGNGERNNYDLYLPKGKPKDGLIVCVHGGSWLGGEKSELEYVCKRYCKQGYVTANVDYTVLALSRENTVSLPQMYDDIHAALQHLKLRLAERGIEPRNMALWGYSAGSQLMMTYALKHKQDAPFPIRFLVDQVGPCDMNLMFPVDEKAEANLARIEKQLVAGADLSGDKDKEGVDNLVFAASGLRMKAGMYNRKTVDSLVACASPAALLGSDGFPTIMTYGEKDVLVKPPVRKSIVAAYERAGVPYTLILYPNSGHDLAADPDCVEKLRKAVDDYLKKYFK